MKHTILMLSCLIALSASAQTKEYKGRVVVTPTRLEQKGDSLHVGITFGIEGVNVSSRRDVTFTPVLAASGAKRELPAVEIKGRNNYLIANRRAHLMNKRQRAAWEQTHTAPYVVVKGYGHKAPRTVDYKLAMPYEQWMDDAQLDMVEQIGGCGETPHVLAMNQLVNKVDREQKIVILPYEVTPYLTYVQPQVEAVKRREMKGEAFLDFVVSKTDIRPEYMNNPRELKKITDMMDGVNKDASVSVKAIHVIGFASPEGSPKFNKYLSEARAGALVEYLRPRFQFPREMYHVEFGGENWLGLQKAVEESQMQYKDEVLHIITTVAEAPDAGNKTSRKKQLMDLRGGKPYLYMHKEYFPSLRTAVCKIDFEVKGFDVEEAKEVFNTRPQYLSLNEMYLVANTYEPGSEAFTDVFETAVRLFPEDQTANLNAAAAALARKDAKSAQRYLDRVKTHSPEWYNASGVAAMLRGEYDTARELLEKALKAGNNAARQNLDQLDKKVENARAIEAQQHR